MMERAFLPCHAPRPFLKWAGGKKQLLGQIGDNLPASLMREKFCYVEPFVGSGAVLFWMLATFPNLEKAVINDINQDLMNCYHVVAAQPEKLLAILKIWQDEFHALTDKEEHKRCYYNEKRALYNQASTDVVTQSALFIFLNRTCFNGLYRVNRQGFYNVPMGDYKRPKICDRDNILAVSKALQKVKILCGDFEETLEYATQNSFFYCDPPYKPLNSTSNFTAYAKEVFDDIQQVRLRDFCVKLDERESKWMLSNSDVPFDAPPDGGFFNKIYQIFHISKVQTNRKISAKAEKKRAVERNFNKKL